MNIISNIINIIEFGGMSDHIYLIRYLDRRIL